MEIQLGRRARGDSTRPKAGYVFACVFHCRFREGPSPGRGLRAGAARKGRGGAGRGGGAVCVARAGTSPDLLCFTNAPPPAFRSTPPPPHTHTHSLTEKEGLSRPPLPGLISSPPCVGGLMGGGGGGGGVKPARRAGACLSRIPWCVVVVCVCVCVGGGGGGGLHGSNPETAAESLPLSIFLLRTETPTVGRNSETPNGNSDCR